MSTLKLLLIGLGSRITIMAVGLVNTLLLAGSLGPAGVGEYFLLVRLVAVLTVLADFGLRQSANVFSGHHEEWTSRIHSILLRFTLVSWLSVSVVGGAVIWFARDTLLHNFPSKWIWVAFLILSLSLYANLWNAMTIGRGRIWQLNLVQLVVSTTSLVLIIVFIVGLSGGVSSAVMIYLVTTIIQVLMMLAIAYRSNEGSDSPDIPPDLSRQMLSFGLRGHPGAISNLLWANAPVFLLNAFFGAASVGIFSVAQQLVEKLLLPVQALQEAIFKKIAVLPRQAAIVAMNRYVRVTWWVMAIAMLAGMIFVPWMVLVFLGEKYIKAAPVARLLLPGTAFISIPFLLTAYFLTQLRRPGLISILTWVNTLVNIILSLFLISRFAEVGAALSMTISQIFGTTCALIVYLRATGTRVRELIYVDSSDFRMIREQVGAMLGREGMNDG
jgi:O-antigen/teichoic acid export membrane protein